jgi:hypothetical protein
MPFGILNIIILNTMAEDLNKKILIEVEAETDQLKKNITDLNQTLDSLLQRQKQLSDSGQQSTKAFQDMAAQVKAAQTAIENYNKAVDSHTKTLDSNNKAIDNNSKAVNANVKVLDSSKNTLQQNKDVMESLLKQYDKLSKSEGDHSANVKSLNVQIGTLSNTISKQVQDLTKNRTVFDSHKVTIDALKSSFDKIKGVSGEFGPSLEEAAKGFDALKSGLNVVKTGFTSVGAALKTTGFGLLVLVLQSVVEYFTKTTEGSKMLRGAISAVGVVVEKINHVFESLGKFIIDAVTHPIDSLKALGRIIMDNIINRFRAFSVILDGIMHLNFKKVGDGVIQALSGITDATDKIASGFKTIKKSAEEVGTEISNAYKKGTQTAGKAVEDHESKVVQSLERQIAKYKELLTAAREAHGEESKEKNVRDTSDPDDTITATSTKTVPISNDPNQNRQPANATLALVQNTEDKKGEIKKTALQQAEEFAKNSEDKIAAFALSALTNSIKQKADAKVAALEKDKASELSNSSLTSAQRLAIENKYKKQEAAIKIKAFKDEQKASIAQAIINGAIAITKAEAQTGVLGPLVIPGIIAETAIQVAKVASQKPPAYAKGGLHYSSDGRGGVLPGYSRTDNTNAYLRSGEGIVVSEAMQVPWARNLVSAINVGFGGRDFSMTNPGRGYAVGGIFTDGGDANRYYNQPVNDQKNLANTIAYQMINNFPPVYVDVKDVNNQQNILAQTINRVNL